MKRSFLFLLALALCSVSFLSSCNKDEDDDQDKNNYQSAIDNATAENMFSDVFKQATDGMIAAQDSAGGSKNCMESMASCATLTITPFDLTTFPKTVTVDFGTTNCLGTDGRYRRGIVTMTTTGWYRDSATVITVTPQNYYVNDNLVQGTKTITNMGHNLAGNLVYALFVDGTVSNTTGTIEWTSTRQHEWIEGEATVLNPWDDVYMITGTASGVNIQDEEFDVVINTALRVQVGCRWITAGSLTLTSGTFTMLVNYGDGACDAAATVTINGAVYNITMS
ncbi:MAG: hypothetical protein A2W93_13810 [Bacteroidetes bacterium GWF2_43_63]|nr:MAG: hypothetical protein A2W94_04005 [Bacteroidetes bacterium GWE2_42_42]OFY55064.1 MAG: hypothetical protein A2W93_13810 [Bacteroidetes bacterium GWF2_43_63]HBG69601.1 hypothetical protein [Bacteroidales bacterium]HCB60660.1 hypothetical protein [Bacteroidales bacterium]